MSLSPQSIDAAFRAIDRAERILVTPHANVDPDGISSALACAAVFRAQGKEVTVVCPDVPPESLRFLPGSKDIEREVDDHQEFLITIAMEGGMDVDALRYSIEDQRLRIVVVPKKGNIEPQHVSFADGGRHYDLLVIVDTADLPLLGSLYTEHAHLFADVPILNIDHHISNTQFGHLHLIDPTCASTTEVLYAWFTHVAAFQRAITPDVATLLLTGLITDTRSFQNPNTTPRSLEVAAALVEQGARQQEIVQHIFKTKPLSTLRIWGRSLSRIQRDPDARIVWSEVSKEDLLEMGATSQETQGILDEFLCSIPGADVYILFTELEEGGLKASLRTSSAVDASMLAAHAYGGGGHPRAAGFRVREFSSFPLQVLECIQKVRQCLQEDRRREEHLPVPSSPHASVPPSPQLRAPLSPPSQVVIPPLSSIDVVEQLGEASPIPPSGDIVRDLTRGDHGDF